jgi:hypothetical protein
MTCHGLHHRINAEEIMSLLDRLLWEIMRLLGQLLVGIIIIGALAAAVAWLFGII